MPRPCLADPMPRHASDPMPRTCLALATIGGPGGWDITYSAGDSLISWDSLSSASDLTPGANALFSFISPLAPGPQDFTALGSDASGTEFGSDQGVTQGPTVVPEPSSLTLACLGVLGLIGYAWRSRRAPIA
jgi:PEP-CTERM motif